MRKPMRAFERWRQHASAVRIPELARASAKNTRRARGRVTRPHGGNGDNASTRVRGGETLHQAAWPELLTSSEILNRVARRTNLYIMPKARDDEGLFATVKPRDSLRAGSYSLRVSSHGTRFTLSAATGERLQSGTVGDSIGGVIGLGWQPKTLGPDRDIRFAVIPPRAA